MTEITNNNNDSIIFFARLHWIIFFWPALAFCGSLVLFSYAFIPVEVCLGITVFSVAWVFMTWVTYFFSSLTIKRNQIILRTGVVVRETINIPLNKIEAIDIRQSILGSILRYGMVCVTGTGGTRRIINYLHNPLTCRRYIEQLMGETQNNR